jgi:hypothetical protein
MFMFCIIWAIWLNISDNPDQTIQFAWFWKGPLMMGLSYGKLTKFVAGNGGQTADTIALV